MSRGLRPHSRSRSRNPTGMPARTPRLTRASPCEAISSSPSRKPRLHDRRFRSDRTNLYAATDTDLASNGFPRCSTAQAILASLLAKATTATLRWVLRISSFAHRPSGVSRSAIWGSAARAPCINCLRRYLLPRLLIPSSFGLPPVVNCLGTKPSHAARSRPWSKLSARPTAATRPMR